MGDPQISPISQLLHTLGLTREDLNKRSNEMRQFLTADDVLASRVAERESGHRSRSSSDLRSNARSASSSMSLARSLSRASSNSLRDATPPVTPVKSEPHESGLPHRPMDNMEMVIERQRQSRKERKIRRERDRTSGSRPIVHPPSPSPSNTSQSAVSLDSFMHSRDDRSQTSSTVEHVASTSSTESIEPPPVTPLKNKYYRDHTVLSSNSQPRKETTCKTETPTPTRPAIQQIPPNQHLPQHYAYPPYLAYPQYMPVSYRPQTSTSALPVTPQTNRTQTQTAGQRSAQSPLPPSSPPPLLSSPPSSPGRRFVNQVSSPGPMEPLPSEDQYDKLPYTLPPGPYSPNKPDLSYAALVGQAILSSVEHRLTLQEIYDWITIVYPHYKRGETTWMNSIRHVLSTTVCFRKVPRDRSVGRTLWAIWDEDLECFKGGGFRKQLCKDLVSVQTGKGEKGKSKIRKRSDVDDDASTDMRKIKKPRKDSGFHNKGVPSNVIPAVPSVGPSQSTFMVGAASHPYFPSSRPTSHHQPYYESCIPHPQPRVLPAEVIFPPLPAGAAFNRVVGNLAPSTGRYLKPVSTSATNREVSATDLMSSPSAEMDSPPESSAPSESASSMMSVPELTPNRSSSTSPSSIPATSDMDVDVTEKKSKHPSDLFNINGSVTIAGVDDQFNNPSSELTSMVADDDSVFNHSSLGPVQFWGDLPRADDFLQPGIELLNFDAMSDDEDTFAQDKSKKKQPNRKASDSSLLASPTLSLRAAAGTIPMESEDMCLKRAVMEPPKTPVASSSSLLPSTPPQRLQLSSVRTPISHKGLHMSPSASLAHYKSNLDPPPALFQTGPSKLDSGLQESEGSTMDDTDPMRTPRKSMHIFSSTSGIPPVTPKKLIFSTNLADSPFRTPIGFSPFRTPGSRAIYDPHDPRSVLDEEFSRPSFADSPVGIFGKRSSLLYDSPGMDPSWGSPSKKYWW